MGAQQEFEQGFMAGAHDPELGKWRMFAVREGGRWETWEDEWEEGKPIVSCLEAATYGEKAPRRGFGLLWCKHELWQSSRMGAPVDKECTADVSFSLDGAGWELLVDGSPRTLNPLLRGWGEEEPTPPSPPRKQARARVGVNGRNASGWRSLDYHALDAMGAEAVLLYSFTSDAVLRELTEKRPSIEITCRLFDVGAFGPVGHWPTPEQFADKMLPDIGRFREAGIRLFAIHNEPNHQDGIEGFGKTLDGAKAYDEWHLEVMERLCKSFPDALWGFPALAVPHGEHPHYELAWLRACEQAIRVSDWLGIHTYWQNPNLHDANHLADFWGGRFKQYIAQLDEWGLTDMPVEITEFGNSNCQGKFQDGTPYPVEWERQGDEYAQWFREMVFPIGPRVRAAHCFTLSAPQPEWDGFALVGESGGMRAPVHALGAMERPPLFEDDEPPPVPPPPTPEPEPAPEPSPRPEPTDRHLLSLPNGDGVNFYYVRFRERLPDGGLRVHIAEPSAVYPIGNRGVVVEGNTTQDLYGENREAFLERWAELEGGE